MKPCFRYAPFSLKDAGIGVYLIYGNHDAASKLIKQIRPPSNVHVFRASEAQTFLDDGLQVAIHGQSFATPEITEDLAAKYPPPMPGFFNIGVLHTNLAGISEHANYAPCSLEALKNKGYQYWALGHVHNRQILCADPYIIYPGNIQGRHGKEQGEKSCELVTVSDAGAISIETISTPWCRGSRPISTHPVPSSVTPMFCLSADDLEKLSAYLPDCTLADVLSARYKRDKVLQSSFWLVENSVLKKKGERKPTVLVGASGKLGHMMAGGLGLKDETQKAEAAESPTRGE
jgi:hypothetical protein